MLKKIKIFVIAGICTVFIINNTEAQDKKIFDNVGVYFGTMQDLRNMFFHGVTIGLKSNVELKDRISINMGSNFGIIGYKLSKNLENGTNITNLDKAMLYANMIKTEINFQYSVFTTKNNNSFFWGEVPF